MIDRIFIVRLTFAMCLSYLGVVGLSGLSDTKAEADLRARLAASEAARIAAEKEKTALAATLSKLASSRATATSAVQSASRTAQQNSGDLLNIARDSYDLAFKALQASSDAAQGIKEQSQKLQETLDHNAKTSSNAQIYILAGGILAFCGTWLVAYRDRRWARWDAQEARKLAVETAKSQSGKLDQIHTLVNSSMTAALVAELDARKRDLASLLEIVSLHKDAGTKPSEEALNIIVLAKSKIIELEASLSDRLKSTAIATAEINKSERKL